MYVYLEAPAQDFDDFVELVDNLRAVRVIELRKRAEPSASLI